MSTIKKNPIRYGARVSATHAIGSSATPIFPKEGAPMNTRTTRKLLFIVTTLILTLAWFPVHAAVVYVDWSATSGLNNGTSWTDAYTDLQAALGPAGSGDSIWVAKGTYTPGSLRTNTFQLKNGVALYGGFAGTESSLSERNMAVNVTILSGDIGTPIDNADNSYHVVTGSGTDSTAVLDGFTITMGSANEYGVEDHGAGMLNIYGSPTVVNVIFSGNYAYTGGGGMTNDHSDPTLINVVFVGNSTTYTWSGGGGLGNGYSNPTLINVTFANNDAGNGYGGGMSGYDSDPTVINTIFWGNTARVANQIWNNISEPVISYSVIEGGLTPGCVDGGNNITDNPLFVDAASGNLHLPPTSPAVNSGNDAAIPGGITTDADGNPRIAGVAVDRGAYEYPCPPGNVVYVDKLATSGANNGTSWSDAFITLREALEWGACPNVTEIWVAAGTYYPTSPSGSREATFQLISGVAIYGGFAGTEANRSERNWRTNVTILSGDIGTLGNNTDNSYHVVTGNGTDSTAVLDGFTITKGYAAKFPSSTYGVGGGIYVENGSPTLTNLIFSDNVAVDNGGGAMFNKNNANPTLRNVTFTGNSVTGSAGEGGAIKTQENSNPVLINVIFSGNHAGRTGGAMRNVLSSSPTLTNVVFVMNTAGESGGGMSNNQSDPTLVNVSFSNNDGGSFGGGMANYDSNPILVNTIFWGNTATDVIAGNKEISNNVSTPVISYSLIEGCGGSGGGWLTDLGNDGGNNIDTDPVFVNAPGGDLRLTPSSPAVDAGDSTAIPDGVTTDLAGDPRIFGANIDMGAYESQASCPSGFVLYVDPNANGASDGTSWSDAFTELWHALDWLPLCPNVTEVWVAAGTYMPTDGNDREATFQLSSGVAIYGGFLGTETARSERDWVANETILSGDIGVPADSTDNSYHVVTGSGTDSTALLDGFTITGGNADAPLLLSALARLGSYSETDTKPNLIGAPVVGSRSIAAFVNTHGGGMYNVDGSPTLANMVFSKNYATDGGGIYNDRSSPTLMNVTFSDNSGLWGGAMHNYDGSNPTLRNVLFHNGEADFGAGIYNNWSSTELVNVTMANGRAYRGGGVYNNLSDLSLVNTVLWGDSADSGVGHEIYNASATADISYSLIAGSGGSGGPWDTSVGTDGGNNIDADPLFVDAPGGDLRLFPGSPAMDAGNNAAANVPSVDIDGYPRPVHGTIDMGAYEFQGPLCPGGTVVYVDGAATGGANDGTSWADAFTDLQTAIFYRHCPGVTEIWVAAGTYTPTDDSDRTATFQLANGLAIYGGFAGTETNRSERDWVANPTTLSGDIGIPLDDTDNSYHVVTGSGTDATAVLDGFTITNGYADGSGGYALGGGMYTSFGNPTVMNVIFSNNHAQDWGGGMCNDTGGSPTIINAVFENNSVGWADGGGGGMVNSTANPALINVTFYGNAATNGYGGGMYSWNSSPTLANTIFWGNTAAQGTNPQIYNSGSTPIPTISYSLIQGCGGSGGGWDTNLGTDGGGNIDADPLFVDDVGGDLRVIPISPAIDAGNSTAIPVGVTTDLDGNPRVVGAGVDMGAYEFQGICPAGMVVYVDSTATAGAEDGTSWTDAFTDLRYALAWASVCPNVEEIWVARGTYYPTRSTQRTYTFQLVDSVVVYGGFAGGETSVSQRDWLTNVTILSGDIGAPADNTDNSYHVITGSGTDSTAVLDGFTITGGYANGGGNEDAGGGMFNDAGNPTVINATFTGNHAAYEGGGMQNTNSSSPTVTNVAFVNNSATSYGGGISNRNSSTPTLNSMTFSGNSAQRGGAMYSSQSGPALTNVTFSGNSAQHGAGMYNSYCYAYAMIFTNLMFSQNAATGEGGGMYNTYSNLTLINATFFQNSASTGGGAMTNNSMSPGPVLINSIFWGDSSQSYDDEIYNLEASTWITHSLIEGCGGSGAGWNASMGSDGLGNLDVDPLFLDATGGDFRLIPVSPAVDAGDSTAIPVGVITDLAANPRVVGVNVDMGAYEFQGTCPPDSILYVDADATGSQDGTSWADAFSELRHALQWAPSCSAVVEIWVAEGTYTPTSGGERDSTFRLASGLAIYGGFDATESDRSQRDWVTNTTILSGNVGSPADSTDNSYHVVTGSGTDSTAVLDGFTITAGLANEAPATTLGLGAGMYNDNGSPTLANLTFTNNVAIDNGGGAMFNGYGSSPKLTDVVITGNISTLRGGGILNYSDSHPVLTSVTFSNNTASTYGGGMYNELNCNPTLTDVTFIGNSSSTTGGGLTNSVGSSPTLINVFFSGNTSTDGGGMSNHGGSTPTVTDVTFSNNVTSNDGGGMYNNGSNPNLVNVIFTDNDALNGGGMRNTNSSPSLANVVFSGNTASSSVGGGGAMSNYTDCSPTLINVTFYGNAATNGYGGAMFNYASSNPNVVNTILWGNSAALNGQQVWNNWSGPTFDHCIMQGGLGTGCANTGSPGCIDNGDNLDADPLFAAAPSGDLHLSLGSPAIDAGLNDTIPPGVTTDLDGNPRTVNGTIDMGAYEYQAVVSAMAFPSPLVFTQVPGNQTTCDTVYVTNNGGAMCTIAGIYGCTTEPFSMDTTLTAHTLAPAETTKIVVCVTPSIAGPDSAEAVIVSDAPDSPLVVKVRINLVTAVGPDRTPQPFRIVSVSPNPFNPTTTVHFTLPAAMPVTATVYAVSGARICVLANRETFQPGDNNIVWNGRTDRGSPAASGVYFVRIETRAGAKVARAVLLK